MIAEQAEIEFTLDRILSGRITKFATLKSGEWPKDSELVRMADGGGPYDGGLGGSVLEMRDGRKLVTIYTD